MSNDENWQQILPFEAKDLMNKKEVEFVDVREQDEYDAGHIPKITHIPLSQFAERVSELDKDKELVMVCRSGNRSAQTCNYLHSLGYLKVKNLFGGMNNWVGEIE
ncbi:rhodanese-like domain-containing protein [Bacillus sp. 3255]|uniref:rhodanese-like domain-containing protein n=1 Tax=Bacillus sp. 3255 TaxID=2817904 RepID=UPI00285AA749|nr:rhodanese-like domain-containing protein [Bacillus sp. 3255]MDR6884207.1 rhodanese-related sulfurtransferase [Bacillus sp. 3255]